MPEILTGVAEWRDDLEEEIADLDLLQSAHARGEAARFVVQPDGTNLRELEGVKLSHLAFTVNVDEGDTVEYLGGGFERHQLFATVRFAYALRKTSRKVDEEACRTLARWAVHSITPGSVSGGRGRRMDDAPTYTRILPANGAPEYLIVEFRIRADVYINLTNAVGAA